MSFFRKENNSPKFYKKFGKINNVSQIEIPPQNPKKSKPKRQVVFVNPDDDQCLFWWPALVVPNLEYDLFKQSIDTNFKTPNEGELLVCYFEDGSYSIIPETDSVPFCPTSTPYTTYLSNSNISSSFKNDKAVILATLYWETGEIPSSFLWLRDLPLEDREKDERIYEKNKLEEKKKRLMNNGLSSSKRREKKEKESIKKSPRNIVKGIPIKISYNKNSQQLHHKHNKSLSENISFNPALNPESNSLKNPNYLNNIDTIDNQATINNKNKLNILNNISKTEEATNESQPIITKSIKIHENSKYINASSQTSDTFSTEYKSFISNNNSSSNKILKRIILNDNSEKERKIYIKSINLKTDTSNVNESLIKSILPEPRRKRLKKRYEALRETINTSNSENSQIKILYPIPPIQTI